MGLGALGLVRLAEQIFEILRFRRPVRTEGPD